MITHPNVLNYHSIKSVLTLHFGDFRTLTTNSFIPAGLKLDCCRDDSAGRQLFLLQANNPQSLLNELA